MSSNNLLYSDSNINGIADGCYAFEYDNNDEMTKSNEDVMNLTSSITMEAWVKPQGAQAQNSKVIHKSKDQGYPYQINFEGTANDTATFSIYDGTSNYSAWSTSEINAQVWYYLAGVYDGTNLIAYVNATSEKSSNIGSVTIDTNSNNLEIGGVSTISRI